MASIVTLPQAPNTGLGALGQVLLAGASDYAQGRRQDERESRLRAERLADVESERNFSREQHRTVRGERMADIENERNWTEQQQTKAMRRELVRLGYLALADVENAEAVAAASALAQRDGIAARYEKALATGDLTWGDIISGDAAKIDAGLQKFSTRAAKQTAFRDGLPEQATARANQLVGEREQLLQASNQLERRLAEPEPTPSPQQVGQVAMRLAQQNKKPGEMPSAAEIAAMAPQAEETIRSQLAQQWNQQRHDALVQRQLLNDRLRDVSAELNTLTNRFGVVGVAERGAAPAVQPNGPRLGFDSGAQFPRPAAALTLGAAQQSFAEAIAATLGKRKAAEPAVAPSGGANGYGGFMGAVSSAGRKVGGLASSLADTASDVVTYLPGTLNMMAGGEKRFAEGEAMRATEAQREREEEDRLLVSAPDSLRAYQIRAKRGLPQPQVFNEPSAVTRSLAR
jgi:hypothetical protein